MTSPDHGSRTPDSGPINPDYIEGLPDQLQMDKIEEIRASQEQHIETVISEAERDAEAAGRIFTHDDLLHARRVAEADFKNMVAYQLDKMVMDPDLDLEVGTPEYDRYKEILGAYSVDKISDAEWNTQPKDPDTGDFLPSERMKAVDALRTEFGTAVPPPPSSPDTPPTAPASGPDTNPTVTMPVVKSHEEINNEVSTNPKVEAAREKVKDARKHLAELTASRQSKLFHLNWRDKAGHLNYREAVEEYDRAVLALAVEELRAEKEAGLDRTDETERLDGVFKLMGQYQALQEATISEMAGSKVGRVMTWMTSGGIAKRLLKGAVIGVAGAAVIGATAGVAGGAIGAGLAATGVAALRTGRAFAMFDNKARKGMQTIDTDKNSEFSTEMQSKSAEGATSTEHALSNASSLLLHKLEKDTRIEQGKRRKSTYMALGVVAAGATLTEALNSVGAFDYVADRFGKLWNYMTDNGDVSAKPGASVDRPGGGSGAGQPETGGGAADGPEVKTPEFDYSNADLSIRPGAGLYEQFQKLDIPQSEWSDLLNKVGPELHDVQAGGHAFSYKMPNGEWGIRMTSDGMMPRSAADKIMAAHQELAGTGSTASEVAATPSVETSAPSSVSVEKTGLADGASAPATVENLNAPVNQGALQSIMKHETIGVGDINNSSEFTELSHVASWYPPERIAEKLGLANADWNNLQEYIIQQTNSGDRLYRDVFEVRKGGYLGFTGNRIPSDTMADMLNHVPASVRYRLAA